MHGKLWLSPASTELNSMVGVVGVPACLCSHGQCGWVGMPRSISNHWSTGSCGARRLLVVGHVHGRLCGRCLILG
jgi:hypothetical protein